MTSLRNMLPKQTVFDWNELPTRFKDCIMRDIENGIITHIGVRGEDNFGKEERCPLNANDILQIIKFVPEELDLMSITMIDGDTVVEVEKIYNYLLNHGEATMRVLRFLVVSVEIRDNLEDCLLYTSPSPRDGLLSRMPSSA